MVFPFFFQAFFESVIVSFLFTVYAAAIGLSIEFTGDGLINPLLPTVSEITIQKRHRDLCLPRFAPEF